MLYMEEWVMFLPETTDSQTKGPVPTQIIPPFELLVSPGPTDPQNNTWHCHCSLLTTRTWG